MKKEAPLVRNGKEISHVKRKGILYRVTKKVGAEKKELKQILVPKDLRKNVMEIALAGHMAVKKMEFLFLSARDPPGCSEFLQVV